MSVNSNIRSLITESNSIRREMRAGNPPDVMTPKIEAFLIRVKPFAHLAEMRKPLEGLRKDYNNYGQQLKLSHQSSFSGLIKRITQYTKKV